MMKPNNKTVFRIAMFALLSLTAMSSAQPPAPSDPKLDAPDREKASLPDDDAVRPGPRRGFGPGGPPGEPREGLWFHLSDAQRKKVLAFMAEHFPMISDELELLKERRPEFFERRMRKLAPEMHRLMDITEAEPRRGALMIKERKLEMEIRLVARRHFISRDEDERTELRVRLRQLLGQAFDCRKERREMEIGDLEQRIAELKDELSSMSARRERIIERQLQEHMDRPDPLGRDDDEPPPRVQRP